MLRRNFLCLLGVLAASLAGLGSASALDYPTRPVRWIVPYPAGGATDILARLVGHRLSERLGQQFIIENKAGAGNNIGTEAVVNAAPDGYTLLLVNPANAINASLYAKLNFNFIRDIANEVEVQLGVKRGVDRIRRIDQQERVAVGRGVHDRLGADVVAGAGLVLDDELLAEPLRQPMPDQARQNVGRAAGRIGDDPAYRPRRIIEGRGAAQTGKRCSQHAKQAQKVPTQHSLAPPKLLEIGRLHAAGLSFQERKLRGIGHPAQVRPAARQRFDELAGRRPTMARLARVTLWVPRRPVPSIRARCRVEPSRWERIQAGDRAAARDRCSIRP